MTEVILGPTGGRRRRRLRLALPLVALAALVLAIGAWAGPVSNAAGFEGDDGNLAPAAPINFDWNSFAPTTWTGTAPTRQATDSEAGWDFVGVEDFQNSTADSSFAGGTKQDNDCASVITQKPPGKDDLKRYYLANTTAANGDIFLALAWARIDQQGSPSAHVGFEFNQGSTACPAGSDGLVRRTAGDLLIVYDFEGGSATPVLTLREWVLTGACEVASNSPPCWGPADDLSAGGFAEGRVNTGDVIDQIAPVPPETLAEGEFGEAIINLTDAGVFEPGECVAFGKTYAVSRSSGNSANAQMKDLVGPADINIQNCGSIIINKQTVPSPDATNTSFGFTTAGGLVPATFSLLDGGSEDFQSPDIVAGNYDVTEDDPGPSFALTAIDCSASDLSNGSIVTPDLANRTVDIELEAGDRVDCTFVNTLQVGSIIIRKQTVPSPDPTGTSFGFVAAGGLVPATFSLLDGGSEDFQSPNVQVGNYDVTEDDPGPNFVLTAINCTSSGSSTFTPDVPNRTVDIQLEAGDTVDCTFVNTLQLGAIRITKTAKNKSLGPGDQPHAGVTFTILGPSGSFDVVTDANGTACQGGLLFGDYTVTEHVPTGYQADSPNPQTVSVNVNASCGSGNEATATFHNTPLTTITVDTTSLAGPGVTESTVQCAAEASPSPTPHTTDPLTPGTYTCTVVIDP
jgi:Prealbumin-like fold domain